VPHHLALDEIDRYLPEVRNVIGDTLEEGRDQHDDVHRLIADTFEISDDLI